MSSVVLRREDVFPAGTSVGAYPRSAWPGVSAPDAAAPSGAATETQTVAGDGSLTFTTLAENTTFYAYALVGGVHRIIAFQNSSGSRARRLATPGLVAYWPLGEGGQATVAGDEKGALPGTYTGGVHRGLPGRWPWTRAAEFDGVSGRVTVGNPVVTAVPLSIEARIFVASASVRGAAVKVGFPGTSGGSDATGIGLGVGNTTFDNNGNKLIALYETVRWIVGPTLGTGWHHVALTVDGAGVAQMYIDGLPVTTPAGAAPVNPTVSVAIGGYSGWNTSTPAPRFFAGRAQDVALYNVALPAADVLSLASAR